MQPSSKAMACAAGAAGPSVGCADGAIGAGAFSRALAEGAGAELLVFLVHDDHAVAAAFLRGVQRLVGELDEAEVTAIRRRIDARRTDADGQPLRRRQRSRMLDRERFDACLDSARCILDVAALRVIQ